MTLIRKRPVPGRHLALSELSLGCAQLGNMYRAVSDADAASTVDTAWELGVRYFDTAPHYGLGLSERRLGAALASRPREGYVLSSKVGRVLEPVDVAPGWTIRASSCRPATGGAGTSAATASSARSRRAWSAWASTGWTSSISTTPTSTGRRCSQPAIAALEELRAQGVVGAIGAGMNQSAMLADLVRETDVDVVMLAGRYTLLEQGALDDLLPLCTSDACCRRGWCLQQWTACRESRATRQIQLPRRPAATRRACASDRAHLRAARDDVPAAALAFPLGHQAVASACVGARSAAQMPRNEALYREPIAPDLWSELKASGLLPQRRASSSLRRARARIREPCREPRRAAMPVFDPIATAFLKTVCRRFESSGGHFRFARIPGSLLNR